MSRKFLKIAGSVGLLATTAYAEVVTDGSLGPNVGLSGPDYLIGADLGQQYGGNLFHSFSDFNLTAAESATFTGPDSVAHIIGRVTGGRASFIEGTLRSTVPGSQLWLFNPAGMEQLGGVEVPGGVAAARAVSLGLKDGGMFNAQQPEDSVLTSAPPQAFFLAPPLAGQFSEAEVQPPQAELELSEITAAREMEGPLEEPGVCGKKDSTAISRLVVSHYLGNPTTPDDWQASTLPPLDFEPQPAAGSVATRVVCEHGDCVIRYQ